MAPKRWSCTGKGEDKFIASFGRTKEKPQKGQKGRFPSSGELEERETEGCAICAGRKVAEGAFVREAPSPFRR